MAGSQLLARCADPQTVTGPADRVSPAGRELEVRASVAPRFASLANRAVLAHATSSARRCSICRCAEYTLIM